jgi:hypothetical protein
MLPKKIAKPLDWVVSLLIRQDYAVAVPTNE